MSEQCAWLLADDKVEHLAWRLRHGELPTDKAHHPKIVILHAGTNGEAAPTPLARLHGAGHLLPWLLMCDSGGVWWCRHSGELHGRPGSQGGRRVPGHPGFSAHQVAQHARRHHGHPAQGAASSGAQQHPAECTHVQLSQQAAMVQLWTEGACATERQAFSMFSPALRVAQRIPLCAFGRARCGQTDAQRPSTPPTSCCRRAWRGRSACTTLTWGR